MVVCDLWYGCAVVVVVCVHRYTAVQGFAKAVMETNDLAGQRELVAEYMEADVSHTHAHTHAHTHTRTHTHMHIHPHAHTRAHTHTHACTHTHMHAHTHAPSQGRPHEQH